MGTHPIFESDFDCLTESKKWVKTTTPPPPAPSQPKPCPRTRSPSRWPLPDRRSRKTSSHRPTRPRSSCRRMTRPLASTLVPPRPRLTSEFIRRLILIENGESNEQIDRARLGNDWQFILYFLLAFLFNWVGLFATFCCSTTAAARYGGLSGFGLSLVKWITMLRYNPEYWRQLTEANSLDGSNFESQNINANAFIYLFMFIGLLLFFKGAMTWCRFRHLQAPIRPVSERVIQREV